jgi:hypothetical protein
VGLETGAVVAVTAGDAGDKAKILETLPQAGETCTTNNEEISERVHPKRSLEAVGDKGYHILQALE